MFAREFTDLVRTNLLQDRRAANARKRKIADRKGNQQSAQHVRFAGGTLLGRAQVCPSRDAGAKIPLRREKSFAKKLGHTFVQLVVTL